MYCAETIMITKSTIITSTIGVTLIPEIGARRPPPELIVPAMGCALSGRFG
jgi:hypothetical protein